MPTKEAPPVPPTCSTCRYFFAPTNDCRRFPPSIIMGSHMGRPIWPSVNEGDWCGEHQPGPV